MQTRGDRTTIFDSADSRRNEQQAKQLHATDPTLTLMYDGAGRYAVGPYPRICEDLDEYMAPDSWEWLEEEE